MSKDKMPKSSFSDILLDNKKGTQSEDYKSLWEIVSGKSEKDTFGIGKEHIQMLSDKEISVEELLNIVENHISQRQKSKRSNTVQKLYNEYLQIEQYEAKQSGNLGFMVRALVQATMPHSKPEDLIHFRQNGSFSIQMTGWSSIGLPYGSIPRLVMAYITTKVIQTKSREISLGRSLSDFMAQLDMVPTGGRWGSITRLKEQMKRLVSTSIKCVNSTESTHQTATLDIVDSSELWWDPKDPNQESIFDSYLVVGQGFFDEVLLSSVPVDMRALKVLKKSPLAIDIYCWLTHRMSYLRRETVIPWGVLQLQFGSDYKQTSDFKSAFKRAMAKVSSVYPAAKVYDVQNGLMLKPSPKHIKSSCG